MNTVKKHLISSPFLYSKVYYYDNRKYVTYFWNEIIDRACCLLYSSCLMQSWLGISLSFPFPKGEMTNNDSQ